MKPVEEFHRCRYHGWQRRCKECSRNLQRERRAAGKERPAEASKAAARARVNMQVSRGKRTKQPCESCGSLQAQKHHDDYEKPTEIRWLCSKCYAAEHYPEAREEADRRLAAERRWEELRAKYTQK